MTRESCETILAPRLCDIWNQHTRGDPKLQFSLAGCQVLKDQTKKPGISNFPGGGSTHRWEQEGRQSPFRLLQWGASSAGAAVKPHEGPWSKNLEALACTCKKPPKQKDKLSYGRRFVSLVLPLDPTGEILKNNLKKSDC